MTRAAVDVDIRPYEDADLPQVLDLLRASLAGGPTGDRTEQFFRWKHEDNPFGRSVSLVAEADQRVVGFRTFMRWRFRRHGRDVHAVRAVDTATHPEFQGQGIFTRLTLTALDLLRRDHDLVFNTPNEQSLPGYLKMGWQEVGTVPISIRPVRLLRFARGLRHIERGEPAGPAPDCGLPPVGEVLRYEDAVEDLLAASDHHPDRLITDRSGTYLRWRYADAPDLDYRAIAAWEDGALVGLAIGRPRMRGPLAEFTLSEVLVRQGDRGTARQLLRTAARSGCDHVATHLARSTTAADVGLVSGYLQVPRNGMTLVANPLTTERVEGAGLDGWQLSLGDLEVF